jgi:hypothetical protein
MTLLIRHADSANGRLGGHRDDMNDHRLDVVVIGGAPRDSAPC